MPKFCDIVGASTSSGKDCPSSSQACEPHAPTQAEELTPCGHTDEDDVCAFCRQQHHLRTNSNYVFPRWVVLRRKADAAPMGTCRRNGSDYDLEFQISSCRSFYPLSPHHRTPERFPWDGFCITAVKLPPQLAPHVTGIVHVNGAGDVPFGNGVWGRPVEGIMLELQGAPERASMCYRVSVAL
jgi:hypothetical protein